MLYIPNPDPWLPTLNPITSDIADALVFALDVGATGSLRVELFVGMLFTTQFV